MSSAADHPLEALDRVLASFQSVRNGRALFVLLAAFSCAGLLLAMAEAAVARSNNVLAVIEAGLSFTIAFYGANTAGLLVMDEAQGRAPREVAQAVTDALGCAHRLVGVLVAAGLCGLAVFALLAALLWACRLQGVGPWLFGLVVPLGVVAGGLTMVAALGVLAPLAAPAIWRGLGVRATLAFLLRQLRQRLVFAAMLSVAVSGVAAAVGALVTFAVLAGGRLVAALAVLIVQVELPPQQLMAGLFGYGLRTLGAAGAPAAQDAYGQAALVGGGVVFALALVLPGVVYLRGMCSAFLALEHADSLAARQDA
jgi:hypothetical protein